MIRAAIVGMGWWGRTLVEAVADSEQIRFVAGATRTVSPEVKAFSEAQQLTLVDSYEALLADTNIDAVVLATPHSLHAAQTIAAAKVGQARLLREALRPAQGRCRSRGRRHATQAGVTLGLGYNRRFHPEMTKLRQQIQSGRARDAPALRSDDDLPECAVSESRTPGARTKTRRPAAG